MGSEIIKNVLMNEFTDNENIINNLLPIVMDLAVPSDRTFDDRFFDHRDSTIRIHNVGYFENVIPRYSFNEFKAHFGMSPQAMQVLCESVAKRLPNAGNLEIPLEKKVLFGVWRLSKSESYETTDDMFNFSKSTAQRIFSEMIDIIADAVDEHIKWPTPLQQQHSSEVFKELSKGFGGIVGVLDACHIQIKKPENNDDIKHSIILQGICNEKSEFINVSTGYPRGLHDAHVFRLSPIGQALEDDHKRIVNNPDHHLIGDAAYGLTSYLLTPFRRQGRGGLTSYQSNYNRKLSSAQSVIKRCYRRLKGKFCMLNQLEQTSPSSISKTVLAACVIHNIIIEQDGCSEDEYSDVEEDPPKPEVGRVQSDERGRQKRDQIAATLP